MASLTTSASERASIEAFRRDVIEASMDALVLVDFWAEWCGPCKTLGPLLDRVVASYAPRVKLVKIDVDKNQTLAAQFRIQSIPTVYAFLRGQPVDGFMGGLGERELKAFIDRLLAAVPGDAALAGGEADIGPVVEAAQATLAEGAYEEAASIFAALHEQAPDRADIAAGLARALIGLGSLDQADSLLASLPPEAAKDAAISQARAALALARDAAPVDDLAGLRAAVEANPEDHEKRFELAGGLMAHGDRDGAVDQLLEIIRRDRNWNEGAARDRLLKLFESIGLDDPFVAAARRRLSAILFA